MQMECKPKKGSGLGALRTGEGTTREGGAENWRIRLNVCIGSILTQSLCLPIKHPSISPSLQQEKGFYFIETSNKKYLPY